MFKNFHFHCYMFWFSRKVRSTRIQPILLIAAFVNTGPGCVYFFYDIFEIFGRFLFSKNHISCLLMLRKLFYKTKLNYALRFQKRFSKWILYLLVTKFNGYCSNPLRLINSFTRFKIAMEKYRVAVYEPCTGLLNPDLGSTHRP